MSDVRPARFGPKPHPPRDGDKLQARQRINVEVRTGRRTRPDTLLCACGAPAAEYHHHLGYEAAHHYDVIPVCIPCHVAADSEKAKQTHCHKGHEFTPENTFRKSNGTRGCRECRREYDRNRKRPAGYWRAVNARRKERRDG